jgi:hypothetical protein
MYVYYDIACHMKTTVQITDNLLDDARRVAAKEGTTVRALIEAGLRREIRERRGTGQFRLRRASFKGKGLRPEVEGATWDQIRDLAYEAGGRK